MNKDKTIFDDEDILVGLSAGINSMAVLCWLHEIGAKPRTIHLFYSHFKEHSPDSFAFVKAGIRFARKHFQNVKVKITRNSIIEFFESQNLIPHPMVSPCSKWLKIIPIREYCFNNGIKYDLVGYVKHELKKRSNRQGALNPNVMFEAKKVYAIGEFTDEWCFEIVKKYIGWYPAIYDIKDEKGKRIFKHNNCLPCKNMNKKDFEAVEKYYPEYYNEASQLSKRLGKYWGRSVDDFHISFGRELGQESTCETCEW